MDKSSQEIATVNTKANYGAKRLTATKRLTYMATLVAASIVLKIASTIIKTPVFTLSLAYIPWIIAAIVLGPLGGGVVAGISDVLGAFVSGYTNINPILTLSCVLYGVIMGLCFKLPRLHPCIKLLIGTLIAVPLCTVFLSGLGIAVYGSKSIIYYVMTYRIAQAGVAILNSIVAVFFFPLLRKLKMMN